MNRVVIVGRLGADPETKTSSSGMAITRLRVATSERRKEGADWVDATEWHNVVLFGKRAEFIGQALAKGSFVAIEGKLRTSWWENDGEKRYRTEILCDDINFDRKAREANSAPANAGEPGGDDDIPF